MQHSSKADAVVATRSAASGVCKWQMKWHNLILLTHCMLPCCWMQ